MGKKSKPTNGKRSAVETKERHEREVEGGVGGAIAGAALGALAGPPGAATGALLGALAGAIAGAAIQDGVTANAAEDRELDASIGVSGGELGAPNLAHPPARIGAYSAGSLGAGVDGGGSPAEGPMQAPS